jgi:tetratricopeptide (TPR) repeat protein
MRPKLLTLFLLTLSPLTAAAAAEGGLDSLYAELEDKIENNSVYRELKEDRIKVLKREVRRGGLSRERAWELNSIIAGEYRCYISDSAILYMNRGLDAAHALRDTGRINTTTIDLALLFSALGMYKEALDLLEDIDRKTLAGRQPTDYYMALRNIYIGLMMYSQNDREKGRYRDQMAAYRDTLLRVAPHDSEEWMQIEESRLRSEGDTEGALSINDKRMEGTIPGTPAHALITFHRSLIHRAMGLPEEEERDLILSAISDIQSAIRDNASLPLLAGKLMDKGDIDRAYRYVKYSLDNITGFNTRVRSSEIITIQKIINEAYHKKNEQQQRMLRLALVLISLMSVLLVFSVILVSKQMRRSVAMGRRLEQTNAELIDLNHRLHEMNGELQKINLEVTEANVIKEEYISYFLGECSKYIEKMDSLRRLAAKKLRERKFDELLAITRGNLKEEELRELHNNFDKMFVHLFPDFVEKFNSLLLPDEQIVLKKGEVLNIELRIYALIRLGIDDSCKIASFLGYSVYTIYNYRTKVKNKAAIARSDFEWTVKRIGTFASMSHANQ